MTSHLVRSKHGRATAMLGRLQIHRATLKRGLWPLVAALFLCPTWAAAQTWNWTTEDVDVQGESTSIVADADGNLHLSYYAATGGKLKYAFRSEGNGKWFNMEIEHGLGFMLTRITADSNANPHICYTPHTMKYAHWDGGKWRLQSVDSGSGVVGFWCSIQVSAEGNPQISWYLESGTYFRYAILKDGVWAAQSIEGGGGALPGKWNSMTLDAQNHPQMSYTWFPTGQLKYTAFNGKNWNTMLLDSPADSPGGQRGMGSSLILNSQGSPMISYYDEQSLKLARYIDGKWKKETVEELPPFGQFSWRNFRSSLMLDSTGAPHIVFESLKGLEHIWWDGKQWRPQMLLPSLGATFFDNSMTIDKNDDLFVSYKDPVDGSLKVLVGRRNPKKSVSNTASAKMTSRSISRTRDVERESEH
jgi:hypothetical protein